MEAAPVEQCLWGSKLWASEKDMPQYLKDFAIASPTQSNAAPSSRSTLAERMEEAARPQPVALEVPVTVHGARAVEGSSKREPFTETTRTVLIFANGAVIRLSSAVAPGQLLFLTNESTKKEVVCQVVKSKNYKNVSGYVELEFTEASIGFWGMRFPSDRITPVATAPPVPPAQAANAPRVPETKSSPGPPRVAASGESTAIFPGAAESKPSAPAPPLPKITLPPPPSVPPKQDPVKPVPAPSAPAKGAAPSAPPLVSAQPVLEPASFLSPSSRDGQVRAEILTSSKQKPAVHPRIEPEAAPSWSEPSAKPQDLWSPPPPTSAEKLKESRASAFEEEGIPVPSWFDPAARKSAQHKAPSPASADWSREPATGALEEKPAGFAERAHERVEPLAFAPAESTLETYDSRMIGGGLLLDESQSYQSRGGRSGRGRLVGALAAVLVLGAAAGVWHQYGPMLKAKRASAANLAPSSASTASVLPSAPSRSVPAAAGPAEVPPATKRVPARTAPTNFTGSPNFNPAARAASAAANSASTDTASLRETARKELRSTQNNPAAKQSDDEPEKDAPKKPALPQIHLGAPVVQRNAASAGEVDAEPNLPASAAAPPVASDVSPTALVDTSGPAAPKPELPVGGDVQPARLLSSVPPVYPLAARSLHISGDVVLDAQIGVNGRVTSVKVISGAPLLHQAAMDALKQWKYAPATLDGKAVPIHMMVTIRFRVQ